MTEKLLPSLEIHGFRAFDHLTLKTLGRVNLIVGKNNAGKTSLLEAIWIYANQGSPAILRTLLEGRDEIRQDDPRFVRDESENQILPIRYLFNGRSAFKSIKDPIIIGPIGSPDKTLRLNFKWYTEFIETDKGIRRLLDVEDLDQAQNPIPGIAIQFGKGSPLAYRLDRQYLKRYREPLELPIEGKCIFVPANGLSSIEIEKYWDSIALTSLEDDILQSLQIIEPGVDRINFVGLSQYSRGRERVPIVKLHGVEEPIPLRSLGEGMNRLLGIALALANARGKMLLIDEVESGLHYSVQLSIWQLIFRMAKQLDVEVFATTHSWDCVEAFQESAQESEQDGYLIRLENKMGKIVPTLFDEKKLSVATREQIEIR